MKCGGGSNFQGNRGEKGVAGDSCDTQVSKRPCVDR